MSKLLKSKFLLGVLVFVAFAAFTSSALAYTHTGLLKLKSTGSQVMSLQQALNGNGFLVSTTGAGSPGLESTYFGTKTLAAVKAFQSAKGLVADGVVGAKTGAALESVAGGSTTGGMTYPAGCTSGSGFSSTTGMPCSGGVSFPAGCSSSAGFSVTTGLPCASGTVVVPTTGAVNVMLASDNPASGTLLIDDTTGVMQNAAPVLKLVFSNGTGAPVNVNTLKLTRTGIAADGDINNLYLYEGTTKLAELSSVSTKVFSFNSSNGLFSIPANGSKTVWVGVNMGPNTTGPNTVGFSVMSSSDVVLGGGGVAGGSFPVNGNQFTTAFITDLGYINLTNTSTYPATLDPKSDAQELWRFTATANAQKMAVKRIVMTLVGTVTPGDIQDLSLSVGGVQVGPTVQMGSDNKVVFDWSSAPYTLLSGQNKIFVLNGKVVKGTGRAFKFTIRSTADFVSADMNYNVDTVPLNAGAALTLVEPTTGTGTSINNGTLTISRSANSPSGNIASGGLDTVLARFDYKANGEDIKVSYVRITVNEESSDLTLNDGKLYFNGSQVGTTDDSVADEVANVFSLGNTAIIPAGTTGVFEYRANVEEASGTDLAANQTVLVSLSGSSGDATGQVSFTSLTPSSASGQTLTVKSGVLTLAENFSVSNGSTVNPNGVVGATNVRVGSMTFTAGSGEAVNLTQIVVGDDDDEATSDFGDNFQNLTLKSGGVQIATTQGTLSGTAGADYTFSLSPSVTIAAGAQYVVDLYADILTGAAGFAAAGQPGLEFVSASATGVSTGADAGISTTDTDLQDVVISSTGSLTITAGASTPVANIVVMGETDQTLATLDFAAGAGEDVNVSVITITDTSSFGGSLSNIKLYDGATLLGTVASFNAQSNGTATFNLASDWVIPRNVTKTLTIKGSVSPYGSAVAGGTHVLNLASAANVTSRGGQSGTAITETVTSATGTSQTVYRTRATVSKASGSPSGSAVAGAGATVLEFDVAANSAYDAVVNAVALTISGSVDTTSTGAANLYKSTDLSTALATESYVTATGDGAGSTSTVVLSTGFSGIPVGANVRVYDASAAAYMTTGTHKVTAITTAPGTTLTVTPVMSAAGASGDIVYYRPMQPGIGKLFFGAQTRLTANLADAATSITVASTDGFSVGDTVTPVGYDTLTGANVTLVSGCVITAIPDATTLTTTACQLTSDLTIDYDYTQTAANALTKSNNSDAIVYTGLLNTTGEVVSAGTTKTFVVKGDTTGATSDETLRADIAAASDINWDDKTHLGIISVTKTLPVTGGTLTY